MKPARHADGEFGGRMVDNNGHLEYVPNQPPVRPASPRPKPRARRRDGWTAERQRIFLETLAATGSIAHAAQEADITPRSAYRLRNDPRGATFAAGWQAALVTAADRLATVAFERATIGTPRELWRGGKLVGQVVVPSDRLLMFLLRHLQPHMFGEGESLAGRAAHLTQSRAALPRVLGEITDIDMDADLLGMEDYMPAPPLDETA